MGAPGLPGAPLFHEKRKVAILWKKVCQQFP